MVMMIMNEFDKHTDDGGNLVDDDEDNVNDNNTISDGGVAPQCTFARPT